MGNSPGRAHREGLSITDLTDMFPSEEAASLWFENVLWPDGRCCGHCGSTRTSPVASRKPMPFWCSDCREYFSVKTGTAMQRSKIPLRKWAIAIYLCLTSLKSVSSMKLRRGHRRLAEDRLVHAAPHPRGVGDRDAGRLHRPGGGRRDVRRRQGEEHAQVAARQADRARRRRQDGRRRCPGPRDEEGPRHRHRQGAGADAARVRREEHGRGRHRLHRRPACLPGHGEPRQRGTSAGRSTRTAWRASGRC